MITLAYAANVSFPEKEPVVKGPQLCSIVKKRAKDRRALKCYLGACLFFFKPFAAIP